jgi:type IV pilus assembly protein PilX
MTYQNFLCKRPAVPPGPVLTGQRGSVLIVSLIMLLLISLIGLGSMQGTTLQERMASNLQDRNLAFQASEQALRAGEVFLDASLANTVTTSLNNRVALADAANWDGIDARAVTVATGDPTLSAQPVYHIRHVRDFSPSITAGGGPGPTFSRFEITSRGQGGSNTAVAVTQSVFMSSQE